MPLQSRTLRDNAALQSCLVSDPAHVTPGARGEHVGLIQKCVLVLDDSRIAPDELRTRTYGPSTAAAVLSYKRARKIINRAYQSQADNIVGKMTIAKLDEEIGHVERARTHLDRCDSRPASPRRLLVGAPSGAPVNLGATLAIHLQRTDQLTADADIFVGELLARARELLKPHGLKLIEVPGPGLVGPPVPWPERTVDTRFSPDRFAVRKAAISTTAGDPSKVLRVILCGFVSVDHIKGITDGGELPDASEKNTPKFCLINTQNKNPDRGTLLHEMIHASFKGVSPLHDGDAHSVYSEAEARDRLFNAHAKQLSGAFFAR
jgi:hypothetical protein